MHNEAQVYPFFIGVPDGNSLRPGNSTQTGDCSHPWLYFKLYSVDKGDNMGYNTKKNGDAAMTGKAIPALFMRSSTAAGMYGSRQGI